MTKRNKQTIAEGGGGDSQFSDNCKIENKDQRPSEKIILLEEMDGQWR